MSSNRSGSSTFNARTRAASSPWAASSTTCRRSSARPASTQALAANPDVKLLDFQVANWTATEALEKTNAWLTQFGDEIGGIWAANDDMALGAVEALRADGRAGKVPVTGIDGIQLAVEAIMAGEMAGTVAWDPYLAGRHGPVDRLPRQDRQVRSGHGAEGPPRVLRHGRDHHHRERPGILREQHQGRAEARLERHLGPRQRARSSTAERLRRRAAGAAAVPPACRWDRAGARRGRRTAPSARQILASRRCCRAPAGDRRWLALVALLRPDLLAITSQSELPHLRQLRPHHPGGDDPAGRSGSAPPSSS